MKVRAIKARMHKGLRPQRDNCLVCKGTEGGVRGNENIVAGIRMCDYCTCAFAKDTFCDELNIRQVRALLAQKRAAAAPQIVYEGGGRHRMLNPGRAMTAPE